MRQESREFQSDFFTLVYEDQNTVLDSLRNGETINVMVNTNYQIVLAKLMHARIARKRGIEEDEILFEGNIRIINSDIVLGSAGHNIDAPSHIVEAIRKKISQEITTQLN
ncbi:MAG: hypothetical protein KW793_02885 [Candidatus Doudnabacteria bacterium]|nr:hypothetical protein [Candidatus Doudnabacteria bacterium]